MRTSTLPFGLLHNPSRGVAAAAQLTLRSLHELSARPEFSLDFVGCIVPQVVKFMGTALHYRGRGTDRRHVAVGCWSGYGERSREANLHSAKWLMSEIDPLQT